jgi:hypothetical protein
METTLIRFRVDPVAFSEATESSVKYVISDQQRGRYIAGNFQIYVSRNSATTEDNVKSSNL